MLLNIQQCIARPLRSFPLMAPKREWVALSVKGTDDLISVKKLAESTGWSEHRPGRGFHSPGFKEQAATC